MNVILPILVIIIGAACLARFSTRRRPVTVLPGAKAGDLVLKPSTARVKGKLYQVDSGTLVVSENRADPAARLIALPVKRIHSPAQAPAEPVFHLSGGPGISNMAFQPPAWLLEKHDVVLVGYRGVDGTPKLDCPEVSRAMRGTGRDLLSPASLDYLGEAFEAGMARLQAEGVDLSGYTIPEVVEDLETARCGLGYAQINLLSESYGTRVAQIYAAMHPGSLLRSAMLGVNPPGHFLWLPETTDAQIGDYANLWRKSAGDQAPDLETAMRNVNAAMPAGWRGLPIDAGKVRMIAFVLLYHRTTAPIVFDAYLSAARGDPSGLALMSTAYDLMLPAMMTWGEFFAIGCSADYTPGFDYRARLSAPGTVLGAPMSLLIWGSISKDWPALQIPAAYRQVQPSDVETLLIGGSVDFSTPAEFARDELLPTLRHGKQVILAEYGHTDDFWKFQPAAAERLLTSFYETGQADDSGYTYLPMDFKPALRFPTLAKFLLATGVLWGIRLVLWLAAITPRRTQHPSRLAGLEVK